MRSQASPTASPQPQRERQIQTVDVMPLLAIGGNDEFIIEAYRRILNRLPDIDGLLNYRFQLREGYGRQVVLAALEQSHEGRASRVVLRNLPPPVERGLISRLVRGVRFKVRWLFWRIVDRPSESIELRLLQADASRYWELNHQAATTFINRQQAFEGQLHVWRREMEENGLKVAAALDRLEQGLAARHPSIMTAMAGEIAWDGMRFTLPSEEWAALSLAAVARHVPNGLVSLLKEVLRPGMVIADAGAGAGVFSVLVSRAIQPGGKLFALEAHPGRFTLLVRNLNSNGVTLDGNCVALPDCAGSRNGAAVVDGAAVQEITLDSVLAGEPRVDLVRLSLDGAEATAIEGMSRLVASNPTLRILWECCPAAFARRGKDAGTVLDPLIKAGFHASRICPVTGTKLPLPTPPWNEPMLVWFERDTSSGDGQQCR